MTEHVCSISMLQGKTVSPTIYTVGYGNRRPEELLKILKENGVEVVWDVRAKPYGWSSHYSYPKIATWLRQNGIGYIHVTSLGNYSRGLENFRLPSNVVNDILQVLEKNQKRVCLLCAEKNPEKCHRSLIVKQLGLEGVVKHL